jgi:Xaa-Pro aminopeptidase
VFTTHESILSGRRLRFGELIRAHDLQAVVCSSYQTVSYAAGTQIMTQIALPDRLEFVVIWPEASATLLVCDIEASMVRAQTDIPDIAEYTEFAEVPVDALARLLLGRGADAGRIGFEAKRLPTDAYFAFRAALPQVELVPIDAELELLQAVKLPAEVEMLREAAQTTLEAIDLSVAETRAGDDELGFAAAVVGRMLRAGGQPEFFVFGAGERGLQAHAEAGSRPLVEGDLWRIDVGGRFFGTIMADLARSGVVGEPSDEQEQVLLALRSTQQAGIDACEAGRPASEVYRAVEAEFRAQGLPFGMPHIGHGLGIGLHEYPLLEPRNETPLAEGMVLNIEPLVALPDRRACYHIEDLVLVGESGPTLLTTPQETLLRMAPR